MPTGAPDYYKSILLYGLYDGQAVPLACDEQGRLILVMEEVSPFDKAGTILLRDDFTTGLTRAETGGTGTGNDVSIDTTEALIGGMSCKLTGGSSGDRTAKIIHRVSVSSFTKHGYQFSLRLGNNVQSLTSYYTCYTGTKANSGRLSYNVADKVWRILDYNGVVWRDIVTDLAYLVAEKMFHTVKVTFDLENEVYGSFRHMGEVVDLSDYAIQVVNSAVYPRLTVYTEVVSTVGANGVIYLDDVIITQDES